jgi:serine/threonine protein phosphatase PrpC
MRLPLPALNLWLSICSIPGDDPLGPEPKACQDTCFSLNDEAGALIGVLDGHGPTGRELVLFCKKRIASHFASEKEKYTANPQKFLEDLISVLETEAKSHNAEFNSEESGCTVTLVLLVRSTIYTACIGDLKAVVGTLEKGAVQVVDPRAYPLGYQEYVDSFRITRAVTLSKPVYALKISQDKRPEDMTEVVRIVRSGGRVHRPVGKSVGPMMIWRGEMDHPGLTVSRAIGDGDCADLGIISEAEMTEYQIRLPEDQFVIVGSSGLWEVMEDIEVVKFVEKYRETCTKGTETWQTGTPVPATGVSIAHLLCEEARMRWVRVLEKERNFMEDITVVVAELEERE